MDDFEETFVLDDLLSFLACKLNKFPKEILFKRIREFYPNEAITGSLKTLLESLPNTYDFPDKNADPLEIMFECLHILPEEDKPVFLCRNLDNVPKLTCDQLYSSEWTNEAHTIREEQIKMNLQLDEIFAHVNTLKAKFKDAEERLVEYLPDEEKEGKEVTASATDQDGTENEEQSLSPEPPNASANPSDKTQVTGAPKKIIFVQEKGKLRMLKPS